MRILVDENVPLAEEFLGELGEITRLPGREITAESLRGHDVLVVRSITRVTAELLAGADKLRFVGTCTIGTDHIDHAALRERGIAFASAPGSNADSVVDYVFSSLLLLAEEEGFSLAGKTIGIVGAGNVGGRLAARLDNLDIKCLLCDPPRAEREDRDDFLSLDELIAQADILSLHTPLVREGEHATHHLLDRERIEALKPGTVLLNTGRGDCLDGDALRERLERDQDLHVVLDVWEHEPGIDAALADRVDIATPHIAGYSVDGKMLGTEMIYQAAMHHFGLPARRKLGQLKPDPWLRKIVLNSWTPPLEALSLCARACYDVRRDMLAFERYRRRLGMAEGFDAYRREYLPRREFQTLRVELKKNRGGLRDVLEGVGFSVKLSK